MTIEFDATYFRLNFPAFANVTTYTTAVLQRYWDQATVYISDRDYACYMLAGRQRVLALNQLTAHIAQLYVLVADADDPATAQIGLDQSATIDKVSVTVTPPPVTTQFAWWLSLTPYGQMLLALLQGVTAGGFYVGAGVPERSAFRKAGGVFAVGPWPR